MSTSDQKVYKSKLRAKVKKALPTTVPLKPKKVKKTKTAVVQEKPEKEKTHTEDLPKFPKGHIPKKVRTDVWNTFIGPNIPIHKCLCCLKTTICMTDFQVGHVVSEHDGGNLNIDNLRPICASCNISMGVTNMKEYVVKYGYLI
jgi:5-methylcytosine-specific restriction endonuclease McrA